jgi:dihydrofolate synthase/folylpolyglutamate synthase
MTFQQARAGLRRLTVRAIRPGVDRTRWLLSFLGHPDKTCPAIQITGTNGKGSVAAMLASILKAAGYRTGRFTSPHLEDERERIMLDGQMLSKKGFAAGMEKILPGLEILHRQGNPATTFEAWTILASEAFRQAGLEVAVLEVGMGGRLDATSAWSSILLSILTNVTLDHTQELGPTTQQICREKLGLARKGIPLLSGEPDPGLRQLIRETGKKRNFPVRFSGRAGDAAWPLGWRCSSQGLVIDLNLSSRRYPNLRIPLQGGFQAVNASLAGLAAMTLLEQGFKISQKDLYQGFQETRWPGRLERVANRPAVFLDGAHNPGAARVLAEEWQARGKKIFLIMGVMQDKDAAGIIRELSGVTRAVWTVTPPERQRAMSGRQLAQLWKEAGREARPARSYTAALQQASQAAGSGGMIVIAGSLYNVAPGRRAVARLFGSLKA